MDELIYFGTEVKALGDGRVGGYLVRFTNPKEPDLTGDFFSKSSDLGVDDGNRLPVYYQHGYDGVLKNRKIGKATAKFDDAGLWLEAQLEMRDEYERMVYDLAERGKLGWSSGAAGHLVEREQVGKAWHIKSWPIAEASLTPTPAEPRNSVMPLKSLLTPAEALTEPEEGKPNVREGEKPVENKTMDEKDIQAIVDNAVKAALTASQESVETKAAQIADQKVAEFKATLPEVKAGYHLEVVEDEADKAAKGNPFKTAGEFFAAVKNAAMYPSDMDKRLHPFKATGLNEAVPSEGGFLVPQTVAAELYERMYNVGRILPLVERDPVAGNNMTINAVDETSRVNGSRFGGITSYWLEEAGTITASKPKFHQIALKTKKVGALVYATDEQLEDVGFMTSWLSRVVPEELRFRTEDAIIEGDGVGKPLGVLNSPARVAVTRLDASEVNYNDIINMWSRRWVGASDYVWLVHQDVTPQLDLLIHSSAVGSIPANFISYDAQGVMRMKGRPVMEVEYAQTLGTEGDILLWSPSSYQLIDKASGIQSAASIHVAFTTAEQAFRFLYRVDGQPLWYSALTPLHGTNTVSPMVTLGASS